MFRRLFLLLTFIFSLSIIQAQVANNVDSRTFAELIERNDGIILDVRTPGEYSRGHIKGSTLIDVYKRDFISKLNLLQKNKPIYVYCLTGSRSRAVMAYMAKTGFSKVYNLQRGIIEWQQYGFPLSKSDNAVASSSKTFDNNSFNSLIKSKKVALVDFHAPWCAPCKKLAPTIEKLQKEYNSKAVIEKVDIEANKAIKDAYKIQSIPGLVLFVDGQEIWRHTGMIGYEVLKKKIEEHL